MELLPGHEKSYAEKERSYGKRTESMQDCTHQNVSRYNYGVGVVLDTARPRACACYGLAYNGLQDSFGKAVSRSSLVRNAVGPGSQVLTHSREIRCTGGTPSKW